MIERLDRIRHGTIGLVLFYGYLVAILICAIIAVGVARSEWQQNNRIEAQAVLQREQQERSCAAIKGAAEFWRELLAATVDEANDPKVDEVSRRSSERFAVALAKVIDRADALSCDVPKVE